MGTQVWHSNEDVDRNQWTRFSHMLIDMFWNVRTYKSDITPIVNTVYWYFYFVGWNLEKVKWVTFRRTQGFGNNSINNLKEGLINSNSIKIFNQILCNLNSNNCQVCVIKTLTNVILIAIFEEFNLFWISAVPYCALMIQTFLSTQHH